MSMNVFAPASSFAFLVFSVSGGYADQSPSPLSNRDGCVLNRGLELSAAAASMNMHTSEKCQPRREPVCTLLSAANRCEALVKWDECSSEPRTVRAAIVVSRSEAGENRARCAQNREISLNLVSALEKHLSHCVASSGYLGEEIRVLHKGIVGDENHADRSLHTLRRAIDVAEIQLGRNGRFVYENACKFYELKDRLPRAGDEIAIEVRKRIEVQMVKYEKDWKFFSAFRKCWAAVIQCNYSKDIPGKCLSMDTPLGSLGCEDPRHNVHLHLSVPVNDGKFNCI